MVRPASARVGRWSVAAIGAVLLATGSPPVQSSVAPTSSDAAQRIEARAELLFTDPINRPHGISDRIVRLADDTPVGQTIDVSTYFLGSRRIEHALVRAFDRGVEVHVILSGGTQRQYPQGAQLAQVLNSSRTDGSWLRWSHDSTRGTSGIDHQKIYRFSEAGSRPWLTLVGSMNSADLSDSRAYSEMLLLSDRSVYESFARIFEQSERDRPVGSNPLRMFAGPGWSGYVFPTSRRTPAADPVMKRLASIPARRSTVIRIAMFSMWDRRGGWIAKKLASMARNGARISFIAGPSVSASVISTLRRGGVHVHGGCFRDGTFSHSKDMTATFVHNGDRQHWTWVGSDNWTSATQANDEALVGVEAPNIQREFISHFDRVWNRRGAVLPSACRAKNV